MAILKCKMCGGDLDYIEGSSTAECQYCGSLQTIPKVDDEKKLALFARANRLRSACEFDKAAGIYEAIVADFPEEAEAYWGLVLCKYGIEYVDDPGTSKKIPTCHRSSFDSIMDDNDFELALENADVMARKVYRDEAKTLEDIRKGIIAVSANEEPYDIFVCYKETDEKGDRTLDSVLAQDVYDALTDKGYRVFFSRISLEDKLGLEYEPYIFAALNSAKIMLAFGTDYEYFNAVWVKNEWSRFLKLMAKDKEKHLIPCFKGIDAYDMPKEFAKLQAQDLGKVGAIQDLLRGIEKILPRKAETTVVKEAASGAAVTAPLMDRAHLFLEDGNWKSADEYFEKVLDLDPRNTAAYIGKLLVERRVKTWEELKKCTKTLADSDHYQKAIRFADAQQKQELEATEAAILEAIEAARKAEEARQEAARKAEVERHEAAVKAEEERIANLGRIRKKIAPAMGMISSGESWVGPFVGVCADGTVVLAGDDSKGRRKVSEWQDIVAISAGHEHIVGLRTDGTMVAAGSNSFKVCNVSEWQDITAINASSLTVGLRADGSVVAVGPGSSWHSKAARWGITAISSSFLHTIYLCKDGSVCSSGSTDNYGQDNVDEWKGIVAVSTSRYHTVGLCADGTVVATRLTKDKHEYYGTIDYLEHGQSEVSGWRDIVAISAGDYHTVGLRADGTVVATQFTGNQNNYGQCEVSEWKNIIAISAGRRWTVGLRSDGTVVATGEYNMYVSGWKLFNNYENLEQERAELLALKAARRAKGLCQHCGGELKGLVGKKCVSCSKPKDY